MFAIPQIAFDPGDEGNASMTMLSKVVERLLDAAFIIRGDGRTVLSGSDEDDRMPGGDELLNVLGARLGIESRHHDQAIGIPRADRYKIGVGHEDRPGRADLGDLLAHPTREQQVAASLARGQLDATKDRLEVTVRKGVLVEMPADQDTDRRSSVFLN
jgi:hypothetical protein